MISVNLDRVSVNFLGKPIFESLSWDIHDDRIVGLVGPNGSGKSSLLRLIVGELASETGFIFRKKDLSIGYLPQQPEFPGDTSVLEEALNASLDLKKVEAFTNLIASTSLLKRSSMLNWLLGVIFVA